MSLVCGIAGHRHNAGRVWHDGLNWRSSCVRCGTSMLRDVSAQKWRKFRPRDHDERRYAPFDSGA
jgi:hypothetical protein